MNPLHIAMSLLYLLLAYRLWRSGLARILPALTAYALVGGLADLWWLPHAVAYQAYWTAAGVAQIGMLGWLTWESFYAYTRAVDRWERWYLLQSGAAAAIIITFGIWFLAGTHQIDRLADFRQYWTIGLLAGTIPVSYYRKHVNYFELDEIAEDNSILLMYLLGILCLASCTGENGLVWLLIHKTKENYANLDILLTLGKCVVLAASIWTYWQYAPVSPAESSFSHSPVDGSFSA